MPKMPLPEKVAPHKTALIVVDMQNDYCHPEGSLGQRGYSTEASQAIVPALNGLIEAARQSGVSIIFIQTIHTDATDSDVWLERSHHSRSICRPGSFGAEFFGVKPQPQDLIIHKHRYSAFIGTRLDQVLRRLKVETLIMTGVATNVCVESTARDGFMLDYHIVFLSDCTATSHADAHAATLANINRHFGVVATAEEVINAWTRLPILV
ncbi:MAG: isochorismatase family cysteine hydrolase [Cyanobacteriota bacterium]|nr:isochorismatase family cysteine hydrolase [Cyanobacteriota bacterium]